MAGLVFFIRRPVFATVVNLLIVVFGIVAITRLPLREYPAMETPVVTVSTDYPGASADVIETTVTRAVEDALAMAGGLSLMTSVSRDGSSQVKLEFREGVDIDVAAGDVRDLLSRVRSTLPAGAQDPVTAKAQPDAQPVVYLTFSSDIHPAGQLADILRRDVVDTLQNLPGVATAQIIGDPSLAMRIRLDPTAMNAYGVTAEDIEMALADASAELPAGEIVMPGRSFSVRTEAVLDTADAFSRVPVLERGSVPIRLGDVAAVSFGPLEATSIARVDGVPGVIVGLVRQATANPLEVSAALDAALGGIEGRLPDGVRMRVPYNTTVFISESIDNVVSTIGVAVLLVVAVILLFLGSLRAALVPLIAIPVSILGAGMLLLLFGFSINTLTLLAVVLAIGLVVDDAVVVLENVARHVRDGMPPIAAAERSVAEIGFAVVAMTLTLAAVFVPVGLMGGTIGPLFREFAWTLAGTVLVSGFVALTLSPMLCGRLLSAGTHTGRLTRMADRALAGVEHGYGALLDHALRARWAVVALALLLAGAGGMAFTRLGTELMPLEDRGYFYGVAIGPQGATLDYTDHFTRRIEDLYRTVPEIEQYLTIVGVPDASQALTVAVLKGWEQRSRSQFQVAAALGPPFLDIPGIMAVPLDPPSFGADDTGKPVQLVIRDSRSWPEIAETAQKAVAALRGYDRVANPSSNLRLSRPAFVVAVDRVRAADLGVEVATVGKSLESLVGGRKVGEFDWRGRSYAINMQVPDDRRGSTAVLDEIFVRSGRGLLVPLADLIEIREETGPQELTRFERSRAVTVTANLAPGVTLGEALAGIPALLADTLPPTASLSYAGPSRDYRGSGSSMALTAALAVLVIYLVLAAQFESFTDPLIIMFSVPVTLSGAIGTLYLTGTPLSVFGQIGLITLVGLICKHGILITEFANQLQASGRSRPDAIREAAVLRLRPILMTSGAMILGAVPLALATGAGAVSRSHIGLTIVGGLTVGTMLTVLLVPAVYALIGHRLPAAALKENTPAESHGGRAAAP